MKEVMINWLNNIQRIDGIPPKEVIAFNFGLFESTAGFMMYLVGGFEYSEENDDWACIKMPTSEHRYLLLPHYIQSQTWELVLGQCVTNLKELELEGKLNLPLFESVIAITTGFDEGDLIKIR